MLTHSSTWGIQGQSRCLATLACVPFLFGDNLILNK
jgi:hypothetical protein